MKFDPKIRSRGYCFTLNNYTDEDVEYTKALECEYLCFGKEIAPTTNTPHLQGYLYFSNARTWQSTQKLLKRCFCEPALGSAVQNEAYCSKADNDFFEKGVKPVTQKDKGDAEKSRWKEIIELTEQNKMDELRDKYPDVYFNKQNCISAVQKRFKRKLDVIEGEMQHEWIVGKTGCGKSRRARAENPGAYIKDPNSTWWCGYSGEEVVIIDDFDCFQVKQGGDMKRWLDRYPFQAQTKGGMEMIRPQKIVVTSQYHPSQIWTDEKTVSAINRRVSVIDMDLFGTNRFQAVSRGGEAPQHPTPEKI